MRQLSFKRHHFPADIIRHSAWLALSEQFELSRAPLTTIQQRDNACFLVAPEEFLQRSMGVPRFGTANR
jgi:hypothetical protein